MKLDAQLLASIAAAAAIGVILFRKWIWRGVKVLLRTAIGGVCLMVLAQFQLLGSLTLGVNLVNALAIGLLGLPGFGLLLALKWLTC